MHSYVRTQIFVKASLAAMIGLFALLVGVDNIISFKTNYILLQHVLSMKSMQLWFVASPSLLNRAITNASSQFIIYLVIIGFELLVGLFILLSSVLMFIKLKSMNITRAKTIFLYGFLMAIILWYFCFCVGAGEYFAMWGNLYNAQNNAYQFSIFIAVVAIFINLKEA